MSNVTTHVRNQIPKATKCDYDTAEPITVGFMELALGSEKERAMGQQERRGIEI
jgi:hypothetical protein